MIAKFFAAIKGVLLLLPKAKLLTTAGTALVSVVVYSLFFGWTFAIGFVFLLFVHEMGHVIQLRREGVKASAPMFIPLLGAVVMMKSMPEDAMAEARVGLAGPVLGTAGAGVCLAIAELTNSDLLRALAYVGLPAEPDQPGAGRPVRRRARDGRDGARDVVPGPRRDGRAAVDHEELVPVDLHPVRRNGNLAALEAAQHALAASRPPTTASRGETVCSWAPSTSDLIVLLAAGMEHSYVLSSGGHVFGHPHF